MSFVLGLNLNHVRRSSGEVATGVGTPFGCCNKMLKGTAAHSVRSDLVRFDPLWIIGTYLGKMFSGQDKGPMSSKPKPPTSITACARTSGFPRQTRSQSAPHPEQRVSHMPPPARVFSPQMAKSSQDSQPRLTTASLSIRWRLISSPERCRLFLAMDRTLDLVLLVASVKFESHQAILRKDRHYFGRHGSILEGIRSSFVIEFHHSRFSIREDETLNVLTLREMHEFLPR